MGIRFIILMLVLSTACQSGRIPCPKNKSARLKKNNVNKPFRQFMASVSTHAYDGNRTDLHSKFIKTTDNRSFDNISVEEWECPKPGAKKYMPKAIKENIKENLKKITNKNDTISTYNIKHIQKQK